MKPKKYRNNFEKHIAEILDGFCIYEPLKIPYVVHRNYLPDFVGGINNNILIECKGFFRAGDVQKYRAIRDSLPNHKELIFILHNPRKKLRKGSKMNMSEWCEKEKFRWFTMETIHNVFNKSAI
tara:strand:+ start:456 stop:827 length:372 start_codon:yes stop_codon:yes gene_type:complete